MGRAPFQEAWSAESVGLLAALRVGARVHRVDRPHTTSFHRVVASRTLDQLKHQLVHAVETVAVEMEQAGSPADTASLLLPPQNALACCFDELWGERHRLMAQFTREAIVSAPPGDVALIAAHEHLPAIRSLLTLAPELQPFELAALLSSPPEATAGEAGLGASDEMIEKRAAVAAMLVSTRAFPPTCVLPQADDLPPSLAQFIGSVYPRYRNAFESRIGQAREAAGQGEDAQQSRRDLMAALQGGQAGTVNALVQLQALCETLQ